MFINNILLKRHINNAIKNGLTIGEDFYIKSRIDFGSEPYLISIGNHVRITTGVRFVTHDGGVWVFRNENGLKDIDVFGPITIGNNVHIGNNVIIMPNVNIGDNVVIGCGAVVTKDIPSNSVAVGVPAKVIENIDEYKEKVLKKCDYTHSLSTEEKRSFLINKYISKKNDQNT